MAQDILSRLKVIIGADPKQFVAGIQRGQAALSRFQSSINTFAKVATGIFAAGIISRGLGDLVSLADAQEKAEAKLLTALKGRQGVQDRLIKQAQSLQKVTLFGDEETINAQALLASMGLTESAIRRLTPLVLDLAVKQGTDLRSAADLVAKSVGSSTNALSRYGIVIEGAVGSTERLQSAVDELNRVAGGQAKAAAQAGSGAITQFKNAFGDLGEQLGGVILPFLTAQMKLFTISVNFIKEPLAVFRDELEKTEGVVSSFAETTTDLKNAFSGIQLGGQLFPGIFTSDISGIADNAVAQAQQRLNEILQERLDILRKIQPIESKGFSFEARQREAALLSQAFIGGTGFVGEAELKKNFKAAQARLLEGFEKIESVHADPFKKIKKSIEDTTDLTFQLAGAFTSLFDTINNGADSSRDILAPILSAVGAIVGTIVGGPVGGAIGGQVGGSIGSAVTRGGDIKHSGAIVSRNRSFSS